MGNKLSICNLEAIYHLTPPELRIDITSNKTVSKKKKKKLKEGDGSIYSEKMGGFIDTDEETREYCCECKKLKGKFFVGQICPECQTVVKDTFFADISNFGWFDIYPYYVINPTAYYLIAKVVGFKRLKAILQKEFKLDSNGNPIKTPNKTKLAEKYHGIGLIEFKRNFEEILMFYGSKKSTTKAAKDQNIALLIKQKNRVFTSKIPVMNTLLRPIFASNGRKKLKPDDLNIQYNKIMQAAFNIGKRIYPTEKRFIPNELFAIQMALKDLYDNILKSRLSGKKNLIRGKILGSRVGFSSRMIITPLLEDEHYDINSVVISYKAFLEIFTLEIINLIINERVGGPWSNLTPFQVNSMVNEAKYSKEVNEDLYVLIDYLIKNHKVGLWGLVNRNPTLALGSTQTLKIVHVIKDALSYVMRIHPALLRSYNGDHDGDVLNLYNAKEKKIVDEWVKKYRPSALIVNRSGNGNYVNEDYLVFKDIQTGLWEFTTKSRDYLLLDRKKIPPKSKK